MGRAWTTVVSALPGRVDELRRLDAAVRAPLPLSTRVGFTGVAGGIGCSVAAGLAASVLARRRDHRVLAVNASPSTRSLLWHAGLTSPAASTPAHEVERRAARHSSEATAGLALTPGGLHCLDLHADGTPVRDARWWEAVAPAGRFFDFVLTDWGVRDAATVGSVVSASTVVCVVTAPDRASVQAGVDLAHTVDDPAVRVLLAVVDAAGARRPATGELVRLLPVPAVEVPRDRAHGAARPAPGARLRASTHLAALRLAAALVDAAAPGAASAGGPPAAGAPAVPGGAPALTPPAGGPAPAVRPRRERAA